MKWTVAVALILGVIAAICLFLWLHFTGEISNFGLNAFTESLGILVTVLIVDQLIKRQEEVRLLPQQASSYEDVRLLTTRIVSFWMEVYRSCVPGPCPSSLDELFCKESFEKIGRYLNLDSQPNVLPKRTWWEWLPENLTDFRKRAEIILERHNYILDPKTYSDVHKIATEGMEPGMITSIRATDIQSGFPRPRNFGSYWFTPEGYCETVLALVNWCKSKSAALEKSGISPLKTVISEIHPWDSQQSPSCMISDTDIMSQIKAVEDFRANNKTLNS